MALSRHIESTRGFASIESPTQTDSQTSALSASSTKSMMSWRLEAPVMIPRLDNVNPNRKDFAGDAIASPDLSDHPFESPTDVRHRPGRLLLCVRPWLPTPRKGYLSQRASG